MKKPETKPLEKSPNVKIRRSTFFKQTEIKHPEVEDKLDEFILSKMRDPMAPFGAKDTHFSGGILGSEKLIHAHLTRDVSVLYRRSGKNPVLIDLVAILSHQESGTGTPSNQNVQKALVKKTHAMTFEGKHGNKTNNYDRY